MFVYVGAYTEPGSGHAEGISVYQINPETAALTAVQVVPAVNPSFLAIDARRRFIYAVNEIDVGAVSSFRRDPKSGTLMFLNRRSAHGAAPCFISLDATQRFALVANYNGETVTVLPIAADGSLEEASDVVRHTGSSVDPSRQERPHPHMIASSLDGRFVIATDLGIDAIAIYRLDPDAGRLVPNDLGPALQSVAPGSGPRHLAFSPDDRHLYLINELDSTVTVFDYDAETAALEPRQIVSTLPPGFRGENSSAHIVVTRDGRHLYGSNRGHDSIAIWAIAPDTGELTSLGHQSTLGNTPRNFALDPSERWLLAANQESDSIVAFRRDPDAGLLTATGQSTRSPSPVAILFVAE